MTMVNYFLEVLILTGIGLLVYLLARALPRVNDADLTARAPQAAPHWIHQYLERIDERLLSFVEKLIRRMRLSILKFDNALLHRMRRFRKEPGKETGFPGSGEGNGGNGNGLRPKGPYGPEGNGNGLQPRGPNGPAGNGTQA